MSRFPQSYWAEPTASRDRSLSVSLAVRSPGIPTAWWSITSAAKIAKCVPPSSDGSAHLCLPAWVSELGRLWANLASGCWSCIPNGGVRSDATWRHFSVTDRNCGEATIYFSAWVTSQEWNKRGSLDDGKWLWCQKGLLAPCMLSWRRRCPVAQRKRSFGCRIAQWRFRALFGVLLLFPIPPVTLLVFTPAKCLCVLTVRTHYIFFCC